MDPKQRLVKHTLLIIQKITIITLLFDTKNPQIVEMFLQSYCI